MSISLNCLYKMIGTTKQSVSRHIKMKEAFEEKLLTLVNEVEDLRSSHPGCGIEKMYETLKPDFIGRDQFVDIFMSLGFRVRRKKNYIKTTRSTVHEYSNLIEGMVINSPNQVWQSDITYYKVDNRYYYVVFIIDVYTRVIVGYNVSNSLRAESNVKALKMALNKYGAPLVHHSDRGSQYGYKKYIKLLNKHNTYISMGDIAQDNAYAERINRTIKEEYLDHWEINTFNRLKSCITKAVQHYNHNRKHKGIMKKSPLQFYREVLNLQLPNRPMATIYAEGQKKVLLTSSQQNLLAQQSLLAHNCPNCLTSNV